MRRSELEHILRASCRIAGEDTALVIGSQAIHGSLPEDALPAVAMKSAEADVAFFDDPSDEKSALVEGSIGELSMFHQTFGYYADGVSSTTTATLPDGWRDRLVVLDTPSTKPGRGLCLEPHDLVCSKLVAHREKDREYAAALLLAGLVDPAVLHGRIDLLPCDSQRKDFLHQWVDSAAKAPD